ncbi:MAG: GNAT family protein [Rhodovibrionaceae bacterium]
MTQQQETPRRRRLSEDAVETPPAAWPERGDILGRRTRLTPVMAGHAEALFELSHGDETKRRLWAYLPYGPFADAEAFTAWVELRAASEDPLFYAVLDKDSGRPEGMTSYLNIVPGNASIEIGHIWFVPEIQRSPKTTDALYAMLRHAFDDLGYRRLEWKCNAANAKSRSAARRLGFGYEGVFFRHMIVKGRNRDTAWYSLLAEEWPRVRDNFEAWLAPENFDSEGRQKRSLTELNRF